ncbi:ras-associating and dilute domain-containing protein-like [Paramormyrops kingsleyae]|uniref:Ras-associating and dilute domain-containing protein-like n=1 Tax=Paramormyrops kingsleyae TaxID=1676925 RepID=A0A3B3T0G5_9TELE|nr:ras-associating and dilute domain-containing protein-like [Paramormyrops kingsleyae]
MISREHNYQMSKSTLNIPVGLLIQSPKKRLVKLGRNASNGSVQSKLSSATTRSAESALHRESSKNKAPWHSRGLAAIFSRGAHLDGAGGDSAVLSDSLSEMSSPDSSPSILKIFGSAVSQGAHYKSVLATIHSTAKEIIQEALERYDLEEDADAYVLCELVGCDGEDLQWRSECSRVVGAQERPLLLQAMWRPAEGFSRRFEIQRRATVEQSVHMGKQAATLGSGRLPKTGPRVTSMLMELGGRSPELWRSLSELELPPTSQDPPHAYEARGLSGEREETESSGHSGTQLFSSQQASCKLPQTPCFLLLQGYSPRQDCVIYLLDGTTTAFGRSEGEEVFGAHLQLHAPDILPLHCRVLRQEAQPDGQRAALLLEPLHGAPVSLNGTTLTQQVQLCPWDLVGLGNHYMFLYKDPTAGPAHKSPPWLTSGHQRAAVCPTCGCSLPRPSWGFSLRLKDPTCRDLSLSYELEHKDRILEEIFAVLDPRGDDPKLTPAFLLCLYIQHSAVNFRASEFRRLLLHIAGHVQTAVGDVTQELASVQPETPSGGGQGDLGESQSVPIPDIRPLVLWMANSLELLHFIQQEVPRLLPWAEEEEEEEDAEQDDSGSPGSPWQQAITVLDEVVMFTFQQSVYHLTKSLYSTLSGLLDSSPFTERGQLQTPKAVLDTVAVFRDAMRLFSSCGVHRDVVTQLFAYLFFFTNASVFNTLMERGATGGFYQWSRGVQIRANLDLLMDWIQGAGLADVADGFFQKLSSAVNLLATPRETLLQASWSSLRSDFEPLSPAQLHHMLQQYRSGRACPTAWSPAPQDAVAAWSGADVLESFEGHPPLVLPRRDFQLRLGKPVPDPGLVARLQSLQDFVFSLARPSAHPGQCPPMQKPCSEASPPMKNSTGTVPYDGAAVLSQRSAAPRSPSVSDLSSCQTVLTQKLRSLELQCSLREQPDLSCHKGLALDPSCLLTPPNTPQGHELAEPEANLQGGALEREAADQQRQRKNQSPCCKNKEDCEMDEEVFSVELQMGSQGLGLALVDGMSTPMKMSGIYIRSVVPDSPAGQCCRLGPGDRILAVNGQSLVGMEYHSGKELMQTSGDKLSLLVAKCVWKV